MANFSEAERAHHLKMQALATDSEGRDVLIGLNDEETEFYLQHRRKFFTANRDRDNKNHFVELHDKHEAARAARIESQAQTRSEFPLKQ